MKILVTGSRKWTDRKIIHDALAQLDEDAIIVHGANGRYVKDDPIKKTGHYEGADILCAQYGYVHSHEVVPYAVTDAEWKQYGLSAGPRRNRIMFDTEQPDKTYAFRLPGISAGTDDMCKYVIERGGILIVHYLLDGHILKIFEPTTVRQYLAAVNA